MTTKALVSEEEYLQTPYEGPEPDYLDGVVVERAMPNYSHSSVQVNLVALFLPWQKDGVVVARTELRIPVNPGRYRVVDFCVFTKPSVTEIPQDPPIAIVEILSPDDRHHELREKLADYEAAGVEFIFIAEPSLRELSLYRNRSFLSVDHLEIPPLGIKIPTETIFSY